MTGNNIKCCVCGINLPNKWAVAKSESVDGVELCYCHLHANESYAKKLKDKNTELEVGEKKERQNEETETQERKEKGDSMDQSKEKPKNASAKEQEIVKNASGDLVKKAWNECASLVGRLGGGIKALWSKINPDRSPAAMLEVLNKDLAVNATRLEEMKPQLDQVYGQIVAKKKEYQSAAPVRQRLLKIELQTLMARYKGLEREFTILSENERSIEMVKSRFLEVLAYGKRGKLDVSMVDRLTDDIEDKVDDAEDIQDALGDLENAGRRKDRSSDDFDSELAGFDGELGLSETDEFTDTTTEKETLNEEIDDIVRGGDIIA